MDNRVYYGQYSLKHWIELILNRNIVLPDYQRLFVWDEKKVTELINTFDKKQFVPPITIGAYKIDPTTNINIILDGQQRLTSIFLAYLGLYPDKELFRSTQEILAGERDETEELDEEEGEILLDNILEWNFTKLTERGKSKEEILAGIPDDNYKRVNFDITDTFLKTTFLGFSFLVPDSLNARDQQNYYSSVFRSINIQGQKLTAQESRAPLYFLNKDLKPFFAPDFAKDYKLRGPNLETNLDFVRYLAFLSQYAIEGATTGIAKGYKSIIEEYYERYIRSVVGEDDPDWFKSFDDIFTGGDYAPRLENLVSTLQHLQLPNEFTSIIEMDTYMFGLIHSIVFEDKTINLDKKDELIAAVEEKINSFKDDEKHKRSPNALKYLHIRIGDSIQVYKAFINE